MDDMTQVVLDYVVRQYVEDSDEQKIGEATPLISSGMVDWFAMVSLKRFLERKYGIHIPDAEMTPETFDTVQSIVALVRRFQTAAVA